MALESEGAETTKRGLRSLGVWRHASDALRNLGKIYSVVVCALDITRTFPCLDSRPKRKMLTSVAMPPSLPGWMCAFCIVERPCA